VDESFVRRKLADMGLEQDLIEAFIADALLRRKPDTAQAAKAAKELSLGQAKTAFREGLLDSSQLQALAERSGLTPEAARLVVEGEEIEQ